MNQDLDAIRGESIPSRASGVSDQSRRDILDDLGSRITPKHGRDLGPQQIDTESCDDD